MTQIMIVFLQKNSARMDSSFSQFFSLAGAKIEPYVEALIQLLPKIINFLISGSMMIGIWIIYRGLRNSIRDVSHITADMKQSNLIRHLMAGTFMISIPFHFSTLSQTVYPDSSSANLAIAIDDVFFQRVQAMATGGDNSNFVNATLAAGFSSVTMVIGLFAFIRGFYLISRQQENGSMMQKETSAASILTHIIGGFILTQMWRSFS